MPILHWLTRDRDVKAAQMVPYRLLEETSSLGYGDRNAGNMLIQGDNLEALKALLPFYAGQVKCIYIDPPYNTRSAFAHYDDNLEHSQWLAMMWPRLELLRELLSDDGSIWVSIDDNEGHYLKLVLDEIFGRTNFVTSCIWQQRTSRENRKVFSQNHEYILVFSKNYESFRQNRNGLEITDEIKARYKNLDNDPRGPWQSVSANAQAGHGTASQFYELTAPSGKRHKLPEGRCWVYSQDRMIEELEKNNIYFGKKGSGVPRVKKFLPKEQKGILTPETLWFAKDVGTNDDAKKATIKFFGGSSLFDTPKPESLIQRVIHIATNPGDLVLDSFLGSGTTAAVAHKMGRRYIGIEMGKHAITHCAPRLRKVIDGEQDGISKLVDWNGGGGFRFYQLGSAVFDEEGRLCADIRFQVLAAHIWFGETGAPWTGKSGTPVLGIYNGRANVLLFNGILGDRRPDGGNVLTRSVLNLLRAEITELFPNFDGPLTVYGERSALTSTSLEREQINFKQTPYDVKARR